ncbi:chlorhexidine efflux transporter [Streptomyces sp. TP-A0874]
MLVLLLPITAWILQVSPLQTFRLEVGLLVFFLAYTSVFARRSTERCRP